MNRRNTSTVRRALRLFRSEYAPRHVRHHNVRQWLKSVELLGDQWVLATDAPAKWGHGSAQQ
jgi:hypothetical protein